ncbi:MAG: flagellar export chaperone FlgN [Gemmatimonadales bacterium]|nr:flagellar export chaperone FlgN [Gemmatimonadota bacterium]MCC7133268.1 flagellar export chaperone FlgN [Gemmatimonadales bacterium]MDX2057827.1 flagellar export chaperone FlgN [Gemmatimonadales bacterium]
MTTVLGEHPVMVESGVDGAEAAASLVRGLHAERALLEELRSRLVEQRAALAADDTVTLEQVVQEIGRTLLTLREARRQRNLLMEMVTGQVGAGLAEVAETFSAGEAEPFRALCRDLHAAAVAASRELVINQTALRRAIESGERFLQHLLTVPGGLPDTGAASGILLNQRA